MRIRRDLWGNRTSILAVADKGGAGKTSVASGMVCLMTATYPDKKILAIVSMLLSAKAVVKEAIGKALGLKSAEDLIYLVGIGYGRNKVPFADENISEISCHAMGVHVTDPSVRAIIDIGGQDIKGIVVAEDGKLHESSGPCSQRFQDELRFMQSKRDL